MAFRHLNRLGKDWPRRYFLASGSEETGEPNASEDAGEGEQAGNGVMGDFLMGPLAENVAGDPGGDTAGELLHG